MFLWTKVKLLGFTTEYLMTLSPKSKKYKIYKNISSQLDFDIILISSRHFVGCPFLNFWGHIWYRKVI